MNREEHVHELAQDLRALSPELAERLHRLGYRKEHRGEWLLDETYTGKAKEIYICSHCNHWHAIKKRQVPDKLRYMVYCPYCGARMLAPKEDA